MQIALDHNRIRVIDQFISREFCQELREAFERDSARHQVRRSEWVNLTELELTEPPRGLSPIPRAWPWRESLELLTEQFFTAADQYRDHWGQCQGVPILPREFAMEGARIKCYRPNGVDQFRLHVDVAHKESATRFISFLLYLNDSDAGTEFPLEELTIDAREGRLLMFPPLWTYPHIGHQPKTGTKYILSSYLHYI